MTEKERFLYVLKCFRGLEETEGHYSTFGMMYAKRKGDSAFANADWCAMTLAECARLANVSPGTIPDTASVPTMYRRFKEDGRIVRPEAYKPEIGDAVIFMWKSNKDGNPDHVGVVEEVLPDNTLRIIEGNHNSASCARPCVYDDRIINITSDVVYAYAKPNWNSKDDAETLNKIREII